MQELDPDLALTDVATGDELVATSLVTPRYLTVLIGVFAVAALVLSVVGIYGVMAHFVAAAHARHRHSPGARRRSGRDAAHGRAAGTAARRRGRDRRTGRGRADRPVAAHAAVRRQRDGSVALMGVSAGLLLVAALACLIPARRAARLDPAIDPARG